MHISWLGTTAIKVQTKPFDEDVTIVIDPYKPAKGSFPRSLTADIALYTRGEKDSVTISGSPFVLSHPGECETSNVLMHAVEGHEPGQTLLRFDAEGMSIAHLGMIQKELTTAQLDVLAGVDILMLPIGDLDESYGARSAVKAIQAIEPRIVIPLAYKSDNDPRAKDVAGFLKEVGVQPETHDKKVIIKQKDLQQEEMKVIVVTKE